MHYSVYFIPFDIKGPVYLELLKSNINGASNDGSSYQVHRFSWKHLFFSPLTSHEHRIVHIHWESNVYGSKYIAVSLVKILLRFPGFWLLKKLRGVKIIWTMHNLHSHDYPHPRIDTFGRSLMWKLADKVLLHEKSFAQLESQKRKDVEVECIPPGNYIGAYGPVWSGDKYALRREYGIPDSSIVLLSLGSVRPYKALPELISCVQTITKKGVPICLFIAGQASALYGAEIKALVGDDPSIILYLQYVDDQDIPKLHGLADYSAFYYGDSALGSAAILLSLSYGVPVISRDFAVSELVVEGKNGFKFHDNAGLTKILENLPNVPAVDRSTVIGTVSDWDWKKMGEATRLAYNSLYIHE